MRMRLRTRINRDWYRRFGKRLFDVAISSLALILLLPLFVLLAIAIRIAMGHPVVFRQPRPGLNERNFTMLKFRTMSGRRDEHGELLPDGMRVTQLGKLLRASSLDELPELWNILRGDMSLVGPRPLLVEYLPYYSEEQRRRHLVRPGMTGLAQISGRNQTTWERRLALDVLYVDRYALSLDCRIIARTVIAVLRGDGGVDATENLGRFQGSDPQGRCTGVPEAET